MIYELPRSIAATSAFLFITIGLFAQSNKVLIHYGPPVSINFAERAQHELAHPVKKKSHSIEQGEDRDKNFKHKPKPVPADAVSFSIKMPGSNFSQPNAEADSTPVPNLVFNGIQDNGSLTPPDINGAAGNTYLMETTNQEFDIFKKSGGLAVASLSLDTFFAGSGAITSSLFDPHVLYDAAHQRYLVSADGEVANGDGGVFIGISQTDDPTGNWFVYSLDGIGNTSDFLDYPLMGFNNSWVVLTANDFLNIDDSVITKIYVFNRDSLYAGLSGTASQFTDVSAFTICPVATSDNSLADEFMIVDWDGNSGGQGFVQLSKITGPANSPSYTVVKTIGMNQPWNEFTVGAAQKDITKTISAGDTRIENAVYANGSIWFTHTIFLPATGFPTYTGADVWQLDLVTDSVLQFIRVADSNKKIFYYYPSVNVNNIGDVVLGYSISSADLFVSAGYAYRASADPVNTIRPGLIFKSGLAPYFKDRGTGNRWGDFTYTCPDPLNNSFWTFGQFANTGENWGTVVANAIGPSCSGGPTAGTITPLADTVCGGTGAELSLSGNTANEEGLLIQWQQSATGANTDWKNISGATSSPYFTDPLYNAVFFRCIIACNNSGLADTTAPLKIIVQGIISVPNDSVCEIGINRIVVHGTGPVNWYINQSSSSPIFTGDTLTADMTGDTTFYVTSGSSKHYVTGIDSRSVGSGSQYDSFIQGLEFTAISNCVLDSFSVYPASTGIVQVNLIDVSTNQAEASAYFTIDSSSINKKTVLHLNMNLEGGKGYYINAGGTTVRNMFRTSKGAVYPYVIPGILSINHAINVGDGYYYFFYNWHVSTGCGATRVPVTVHIDKLIITGLDTLCLGDSDVLSVTNASSVVWQPGNIHSNSITVFPTDTTTYLVSGIDSRGCALSDSFTVNVKVCVLGVQPLPGNSQVSVFPNPAMNEVNIEFNNVPVQAYAITLFNTLGQKIWQVNKTINTTKEIIPVNIASFASGVYFISITSDDDRWIRRIVKE